MAGPQTYAVDQAATFSGVVLLSCEPKTRMGSTEQDMTKDGVLKWEVQAVAGFRAFGRADNAILKIGIAAHADPAQGIPTYTPVELIGFQIGVMERKSKDGSQVLGAQVWYRADGIRSIAATGRKGGES